MLQDAARWRSPHHGVAFYKDAARWRSRAAAFGLQRFLTSAFTESNDQAPLVFVAIGFSSMAVAIIACCLPAHCVASVHPMQALKAD